MKLNSSVARIVCSCILCSFNMQAESYGRNSYAVSDDVIPIGLESLVIPDTLFCNRNESSLNNLEISLAQNVRGSLGIRSLNPAATLVSCADESDGKPKDVIELSPVLIGNRCVFRLSKPIEEGVWTLEIPDGYFEIRPEFVEVDDFDVDNEDFANFNVSGAWHLEGDTWKSPGMFTVIDDDTMDGYIPSSIPSDYMKTGYYSLLYPILESLGLQGNLSMEGRRVGFTNPTPTLNDNGKVARRLQNEKGWEIMSHSMDCIGEVLNNWVVDSLNTSLAKEILEKYPCEKIGAYKTSVYDRITRKQYFPLPDKSGWQESPQYYIKPYVGDYNSKALVLYNPDFDIDAHWGQFFKIAPQFGLNVNCYVCYNASSSHALIPRLNEVCPNGFADSSKILYNLPPLKSTAARIGLEGQVIKGYCGDDHDNRYKTDHFNFFKKQIDECRNQGGWIVFYTHAYRLCWKNYIKGKLVSEGGEYPDEWVEPMLGTDPLDDSLDPPARLGIDDWSQWHPCPGTRSYMIWELLKYAKESGMINVSCSEGFRKIGNKKAFGYFSYGEKIGADYSGIEGTSDYYPHFVVGANGEVFYYNPYVNEKIKRNIKVVDKVFGDLWMEEVYGRQLTVVSPIGTSFKIDSFGDLPKGLWIVNGKKIFKP